MINNQTGFTGIVVDMQKDFLKDFEFPVRERMITEQLKTIGILTGYNVPFLVLEYKNNGETDDRILDAISCSISLEPIIKEKPNGFENKHLDEILKRLDTRKIILMGINASACVMETAKGAKKRKYQVISANTTMGDAYKIDNKLLVPVKNPDGSIIKESLDWYKNHTFLFDNSERLCDYVREEISKY